MFGRAKARRSAPDPDLPMFSVAEAEELRAIVRAIMAKVGATATVEGAEVHTDRGVLDLRNIAIACREVSPGERPALLLSWLVSLLNPVDVETIDDAELAELTVLRVLPEAAVGPETHPDAPVIAPGLVAVPCIDLPDTVDTPAQSFWDARGGLARWDEIGGANLHALLTSPDLHCRPVPGKDGEGFWALVGDSFFTASLALFLPEVLQHHARQADAGHGVLVAVPNRNLIAWRVVDSPAVVGAVNAIAGFAAQQHDDGAGALSTDVFWVVGDEWRRITRREGDSIVVLAGPEFTETLNSLF